jgi:hypothetical protein
MYMLPACIFITTSTQDISADKNAERANTVVTSIGFSGRLRLNESALRGPFSITADMSQVLIC